MSQVACGHPIVSYGSQHVTRHVPLTPETKDSVNDMLMKMPKSTTQINAARPGRVHEARDACGSQCANTDLKACEDKSVVIMSTLDQNVNAVAELVSDMMLHSGFEVAGRRCACHTNPSST